MRTVPGGFEVGSRIGKCFLGKSLSQGERVARGSGPGEGYHRNFFFVPLTRRFAAPSPFGRGIGKHIPLILRAMFKTQEGESTYHHA